MNSVVERAPRSAPEPANCRAVVAVMLWHDGEVCLLRRSQRVGSDAGLWHCITGYLEPGASPEAQARTELFEETGLSADRLALLRVGGSLVLAGSDGTLWTVHTFTALVRTRALGLNWEHDAYRWVDPAVVPAPDQVSWLPHVLAANVGPTTTPDRAGGRRCPPVRTRAGAGTGAHVVSAT